VPTKGGAGALAWGVVGTLNRAPELPEVKAAEALFVVGVAAVADWEARVGSNNFIICSACSGVTWELLNRSWTCCTASPDRSLELAEETACSSRLGCGILARRGPRREGLRGRDRREEERDESSSDECSSSSCAIWRRERGGVAIRLRRRPPKGVMGVDAREDSLL